MHGSRLLSIDSVPCISRTENTGTVPFRTHGPGLKDRCAHIGTRETSGPAARNPDADDIGAPVSSTTISNFLRPQVDGKQLNGPGWKGHWMK
jgi:hypothetical protein